MTTTVTKTVIQRYIRKDGSMGEISYIKDYEPKRPRRSEEEIREIVDKRKNGTSVRDLCSEYKMSTHTLYKYINMSI